jgi:hypothetical protein
MELVLSVLVRLCTHFASRAEWWASVAVFGFSFGTCVFSFCRYRDAVGHVGLALIQIPLILLDLVLELSYNPTAIRDWRGGTFGLWRWRFWHLAWLSNSVEAALVFVGLERFLGFQHTLFGNKFRIQVGDLSCCLSLF